MNKQPWWKGFISWGVLLGGLAVAIALLVGIWIGMHSFRSAQPVPATAAPVMTIVPAPSATSIVQMPTQAVTATVSTSPTTEPSNVTPPPPNTSIAVREFVQISGTSGDGLRLRAAPGVNSTARLLGHEAEVFQVKEGPKQADGYTWWYLVSPSDETRSGWAVSNYLAVIQQP